MVGILGIGGAGILSGMNNLYVVSVDDTCYQKSFGFTEEEVKRILHKRKVKADIDGKSVTEVDALWGGAGGVKEWYNGYHVGSVPVVNPFSFASFLRRLKLRSYWLKSSTAQTLLTVLEEYPLLRQEFVSSLETIVQTFDPVTAEQPPTDATPVNPVAGRVHIPEFVSAVNIRDSKDWSGHHALCYLAMTGYLAYTSSKGKAGYVWIPNGEIKEEWEALVKEIYRKSRLEAVVEFYSEFIGALVDHKLDVIHRLFSETIKDLSHRVQWKEHIYQFMIVGLSIPLRRDKRSSALRVVKGAEAGVCDLILVFDNEKTACVFGMKRTKIEKYLNASARAGFQRIIKKRYWEDIKDNYEILLVGVAFHNNTVSDLVSESIGRGAQRWIDEKRIVEEYEEAIKPKKRRTQHIQSIER